MKTRGSTAHPWCLQGVMLEHFLQHCIQNSYGTISIDIRRLKSSTPQNCRPTECRLPSPS